uniref:Uncharacterized protein n=1 Tax=Tanacetum cinerariifolium TaxID=118510 RepID=A0A6L2N5P0_TANCI|nr:hypothetical protein [Tanacetum cinerariifolium]
MASFDYRLNPLYTIKECSSCGALYTTDYCCSEGCLVDKVICDLNKTPDLFQEPPHNCHECGNPVDGLLDTSESSNDNINVVNAPQDPFVVKQDPGAHYGYNCPSKVPIIPNPEPCNYQTIDELPQTLPSFDPTCYSGDENSFTYDSKSNIVDDYPNAFNPQHIHISFVGTMLIMVTIVLSLAWETILEIEHAFEDKHCQLEDILELFRRFHNDVQNIHEELPVYINTSSWDRPTICYNDDDDEDCIIAITLDLPIVETKDSLRMRDEHLDTISATESDEFIKSSVENIIPSPSESEDLSDSECDVPACDDFTTFSNRLFDVDDDFSSSDDESFSDEDISKKIYSNPLFDEEIISMKIDLHHFNAESDLIESQLNQDSLIISSSFKIDSLLDEFAGELILLKSIPLGIDKSDCDPEEEIYLIKKLLLGIIFELIRQNKNETRRKQEGPKLSLWDSTRCRR